MFDFPDAPTPGQNHQGYIWDGEKWTTPVAAATTSGYVLKGGDTMTGNLVISKPSASLTLDTTDTGQVVSYMARKGKLRWFQYTQNDAESGGNTGSSFGIGRCNDAGAYLDSPLTISRADGRVSLTNAPLSANHAVNKLYVDAAGNTKVNRTGDTMTGPLNMLGAGRWIYANPGAGAYYDTVTTPNRFFVGSDSSTDAWRIFSAGKGGNVMTVDGATGNITFPYGITLGGTLNFSGPATFGDIRARDVFASRGDGTGVYYFSAGAQYLYWNGGNFQLQGGALNASAFWVSGNQNCSFTFDGTNSVIKSSAATVFQRSDGLQYGAIDGNALIVNALNFYLDNTPCLGRAGDYTNVYDRAGNIKFAIGGSADPTTYHRNTTYNFQSPDGSQTFMTLADAGITVNKSLSAGTSLNAGSAIYSGDTITANGGALFLNAKPGGNTSVWMKDEAGSNKTLWYWDRAANNSVWLFPPSGAAVTFDVNGRVALAYGFAGRQGIAGGAYQYTHNFFWTGSALQAWVDYSNVGDVSLISDYRAKKDVEELPKMWDTVKALRPIRYRHQDFTPPAALAKQQETGRDFDPLIAGDETERWGFHAHELQEALVPSAASAHKDAEDAVQNPNPMTVIAALTKALQEAMERIEVLEGKLA